MEPVSPDHPRVPVLIAVDGEATDVQRTAIASVVAAIAGELTWSIAAPIFVDEEEDGVATVGVFLEIYSGHPPWGERLPSAVDRAQLDEVRLIVDRMAEVSAKFEIDVAVELNQEAIGWIESGTADRSLSIGLLAEWERRLAESSRARSAAAAPDQNGGVPSTSVTGIDGENGD